MLTFIIPCLNNLHHTKECFDSIWSNSPRDRIKFLFIDNGSTDGTHEYLRCLPQAEVIRNEENVYVNPAWNQGFLRVMGDAETEYVCLANNDIVAGRNWLTTIFRLFSYRHNEFYVPASNTPLVTIFHGRDGFERYQNECHLRPEITYLRSYFPGFCLFFRKEHIRLFYPVPESMRVLHGDDWIVDNLNSNCVVPTLANWCAVYHHISATQTKLDLHPTHCRDHEVYEDVMRREYPKRGLKKLWDHMPCRKTLI